MIPEEEINQLGGDWSQYGEILGPDILALLQAGKISLAMCDKGLILAVERPDGAVGRYNIKHTDLEAF